ncbi:hypothetical protein EV182_002983 [Spiromyces aspiralis]|uniref:Uncharacterized protein n=1 Tax=Spiromyces aspiralis TaxID=68401 RepID=A0ACC1HR00_9FUNG|nr:hypothetical protein EV182_002983 [Spiromyces aspiralis]
MKKDKQAKAVITALSPLYKQILGKIHPDFYLNTPSALEANENAFKNIVRRIYPLFSRKPPKFTDVHYKSYQFSAFVHKSKLYKPERDETASDIPEAKEAETASDEDQLVKLQINIPEITSDDVRRDFVKARTAQILLDLCREFKVPVENEALELAEAFIQAKSGGPQLNPATASAILKKLSEHRSLRRARLKEAEMRRAKSSQDSVDHTPQDFAEMVRSATDPNLAQLRQSAGYSQIFNQMLDSVSNSVTQEPISQTTEQDQQEQEQQKKKKQQQKKGKELSIIRSNIFFDTNIKPTRWKRILERLDSYLDDLNYEKWQDLPVMITRAKKESDFPGFLVFMEATSLQYLKQYLKDNLDRVRQERAALNDEYKKSLPKVKAVVEKK